MTLTADRARPLGCEPNDLGALSLMPFVKDAVVCCDSLFKNVRGNRDLKVIGMRRRNNDVVFADSSLRRLFPKVAWSHLSCSPRRKSTERFGSISLTHVIRNPVTAPSAEYPIMVNA